MSSSSSRPRVNVLRGTDVQRSPVVRADLGTVRSPAARDFVVDRELVDGALADGYQAGYAAGFETGLADAAHAAVDREHARAVQIQSVVAQLGQVTEQLRVREGTAVEQIEYAVATAAFEIAEMLLGRELQLSESLGRDAILRALQFAPDDGMVMVRLHPDDIATLGDPNAVLPGRALTVVADASLAAGDCIVDVAGCRVDARMSAARERIAMLLAGTQ
jgi:flagellar assembly protein FliH